MTNNEKIFRRGTIVNAKKIEVLTFSLGPVGQLKELNGVIDCTPEGVVKLHTKESPASGTAYPADHIAVVRVLGGKVFIDGKYDIYTLSLDKASAKLVNAINPATLLTAMQLKELQPLFNVASQKVYGYITPVESRRVIVITSNMDVHTCYNEWDPKTPCTMDIGDVFVVSDESTYTGYRIGKEEFAETHILTP